MNANAGALVPVDNRQTWLERKLGPRGARMLLAAAGAAVLLASTPDALIERLAGAGGLLGALPFLAAPLGLGIRIALVLAGAAFAAALVALFWSPPHAAPRPAQIELEEDEEMQPARKPASGSAWGALIRLVRGGFQDETEGRADALPRRRRDRHPDAPPRPPLFASRDLPPAEPPAQPSASATLAEAAAQARVAAAAEAGAFDVAPPRSPEPMSEDEIATLVATMPPRVAARPSFEAPAPEAEALELTEQAIEIEPASVPAPAAAPTGVRSIDLPLIEGADLATLAARFERGLAKREAIFDARDARQSLTERLPLVQPDPSVRAALRAQRSVELVAAPAPVPPLEAAPADPGVRVDADVEAALGNALATLRRLTEQGRR